MHDMHNLHNAITGIAMSVSMDCFLAEVMKQWDWQLVGLPVPAEIAALQPQQSLKERFGSILANMVKETDRKLALAAQVRA